MTVQLVDFVRSRLDLLEAAALELSGDRWHIGNAVDPTQPCSVHTFPGVKLIADGLNWLVAEHIALHNPESVLRRCAADRKTLKAYADTLAILESSQTDLEASQARGDRPSGKSLDDWGRSSSEVAVMAPLIQNLAEGYGWNGPADPAGGSRR